jgi:hypothetical protein
MMMMIIIITGDSETLGVTRRGSLCLILQPRLQKHQRLLLEAGTKPVSYTELVFCRSNRTYIAKGSNAFQRNTRLFR